LTGDDIRKHFKQLTRPGGLKGEPEEAERAKIEVMSEIAAQLADLNSHIADVSKQLPTLKVDLPEAFLNIVLEDFRHFLDRAIAVLRSEAAKLGRSLRRD
jgi:hypothetical protein